MLSRQTWVISVDVPIVQYCIVQEMMFSRVVISATRQPSEKCSLTKNGFFTSIWIMFFPADSWKEDIRFWKNSKVEWNSIFYYLYTILSDIQYFQQNLHQLMELVTVPFSFSTVPFHKQKEACHLIVTLVIKRKIRIRTATVSRKLDWNV